MVITHLLRGMQFDGKIDFEQLSINQKGKCLLYTRLYIKFCEHIEKRGQVYLGCLRKASQRNGNLHWILQDD